MSIILEIVSSFTFRHTILVYTKYWSVKTQTCVLVEYLTESYFDQRKVEILFDKYKYAYEIKYHGIANILIRTVKFSEVCHLK